MLGTDKKCDISDSVKSEIKALLEHSTLSKHEITCQLSVSPSMVMAFSKKLACGQSLSGNRVDKVGRKLCLNDRIYGVSFNHEPQKRSIEIASWDVATK